MNFSAVFNVLNSPNFTAANGQYFVNDICSDLGKNYSSTLWYICTSSNNPGYVALIRTIVACYGTWIATQYSDLN